MQHFVQNIRGLNYSWIVSGTSKTAKVESRENLSPYGSSPWASIEAPGLERSNPGLKHSSPWAKGFPSLNKILCPYPPAVGMNSSRWDKLYC